MKALKDWFEHLSVREQWITLGGGSATLLVILYFFIWTPFANKIVELQQDSQDNHELAVWMETAEKQLAATKGKATKASLGNQSMLTVVDNSIKQGILKNFPGQVSQSQDKKVQVKFAKVPFDNTITWLITLWKDYGIQVDSMTITPLAEKGMVQATLTLKS